MAHIEIKELIESGVHFGHLTRKWNPNMAPFVYTERKGIHIIDLYKTAAKIEEATNALIKIAASGLRHEDISVVFSDHILTVSGRRRDDYAHQKVCFYQVEIRHGYFERKIKIPKHVDANNIHATYENGFIMITIPKAEKAFNSTISVKITC